MLKYILILQSPYVVPGVVTETDQVKIRANWFRKSKETEKYYENEVNTGIIE